MAKQSTKQELDTFATDLLAFTRNAAGLSPKEAEFLASTQDYSTLGDEKHDATLNTAIQNAAGLSPKEKLHVARAMAAERIVLNALGNMYRAHATPTPQQRFETYFSSGLQGTPDQQEAFVKTLEAAGDKKDKDKIKMIINVVQTMHPTIYHTAFGRDFETELTAALENGTPNKDLAESIIRKKLPAILSGDETVTPNKQVTVADENRLDRENHREMKRQFGEAVKAYNAALDEVAQKTPALAERLQGSKISDSQAIWRTWAYGADADGRDHSNSIVLWDGIYHQVPSKYQLKTREELEGYKYLSRRRDLRENAKDQKNTIECLIARSYKLESAPEFEGKKKVFQKYCEAFSDTASADEIAERTKKGWISPDSSTLSRLSETGQARMLHDLVAGVDNYTEGKTHTDTLAKLNLVPKSLAEQTVAFNEMFYREYRKFKKLAPNAPVPDINLLTADEKEELESIIARTGVKCGSQTLHFSFDPDTMLYYPTSGENQKFLGSVRLPLWDKDGKPVYEEDGITPATRDLKEKPNERRKILDVVKRLQVINHAIDQFGDKVADRYQVANFENASDFYTSLLLFKEAGILQVEDGLVNGKPKLSLQPLLETERDQAKAPKLFSKLLDNPLVLSYYKALGHADIMVGYSDGAKSAGNMASEWSIYKCTRDLKKIFKAKGIELYVFHGRGRGDSRGGQFDEGQNYRMSPPELQRDMYIDETDQSDGPMNGAISPARGKDKLASRIMGVLTASQEAEKILSDKKYAQRIEALEPVLENLAKDSSAKYCLLVSKNENTKKLLDTVHDNIYKSSRAPKRDSESFEAIRAISMEYGLNMVDAPLHYIGMRTALQSFIDSGQTIKDENGNDVSGQQALEVLYRGHPFFKNMIDKTAQGLRDYDPAVFRSYAKVAGVSDWAEECITDLGNLRELAQSLSAREKTLEARESWVADKTQPRPAAPLRASFTQLALGRKAAPGYEARGTDPLREYAVALDKCSHAIPLSLCAKPDGTLQSVDEMGHNHLQPERNPEKATEKDRINAQILDQCSFTASESNRNKGLFLPPETMAAVDKQPYLAGVGR